jgi:hypothetical protein
MIQQKIDSLKSSFRKEQARLAGTTGAQDGKKKKAWPPYDRINSFYGTTQYTPTTGVIGSKCPTIVLVSSCDFFFD